MCPNFLKKIQKKEKKIASHPLFSPLIPSFSDITKIRKEGTKSEQGTGLGTGLERSLRETLVRMEQKLIISKTMVMSITHCCLVLFIILVLIAVGSIFIKLIPGHYQYWFDIFKKIITYILILFVPFDLKILNHSFELCVHNNS